MKKKFYVLITWKKLKQSELAGFVFNSITMMTDNVYLVEPAVPLPEMTKGATRYSMAYGNRKNGANAKAEFINAKAALFLLLDKQAEYVTTIAQNANNSEIITSAGLLCSKKSNSKAVIPVQPKTPGAVYKNGELVLTVEKVTGAETYCWIIFFGALFSINILGNVLDIDPKARFMIVPAGTSREVVRGIGVGQDLYIQVLAQNSAGKSPFSAAVFVHTGTN